MLYLVILTRSKCWMLWILSHVMQRTTDEFATFINASNPSMHWKGGGVNFWNIHIENSHFIIDTSASVETKLCALSQEREKGVEWRSCSCWTSRLNGLNGIWYLSLDVHHLCSNTFQLKEHANDSTFSLKLSHEFHFEIHNSCVSANQLCFSALGHWWKSIIGAHRLAFDSPSAWCSVDMNCG